MTVPVRTAVALAEAKAGTEEAENWQQPHRRMGATCIIDDYSGKPTFSRRAFTRGSPASRANA